MQTFFVADILDIDGCLWFLRSQSPFATCCNQVWLESFPSYCPELLSQLEPFLEIRKLQYLAQPCSKKNITMAPSHPSHPSDPQEEGSGLRSAKFFPLAESRCLDDRGTNSPLQSGHFNPQRLYARHKGEGSSKGPESGTLAAWDVIGSDEMFCLYLYSLL